MQLYNIAGGSNPRRVRIYLAEKGLQVPMTDVDVINKDHQSVAFLKINPLGKLPVLELDDGTFLTESMAIVRYFELLHPQPPLLGTSPLEQARIEMWNRRMEFELAMPIASVFQHSHRYWADRLVQVPDYAEVSRTKAMATMEWLDGELSNREFIAGDGYSIADISAYVGLVLGKVAKVRIPESSRHLQRWFEQMSDRPSANA